MGKVLGGIADKVRDINFYPWRVILGGVRYFSCLNHGAANVGDGATAQCALKTNEMG